MLGWSEAGVGGNLPPWAVHHQQSQDAERLREIAPSRAQVSGPMDRVSAFPYRLKVIYGQRLRLGKGARSCWSLAHVSTHYQIDKPYWHHFISMRDPTDPPR